MFEIREVPDTNIVEIVIDGSITAADVQEAIPSFIAATQHHKSVRVLKEVRSIEGVDFSAIAPQIGEIYQHLGEISHVALVADESWEPVIAQMKPMYPFPVKFFGPKQVEEARNWLKTVA